MGIIRFHLGTSSKGPIYGHYQDLLWGHPVRDPYNYGHYQVSTNGYVRDVHIWALLGFTWVIFGKGSIYGHY